MGQPFGTKGGPAAGRTPPVEWDDASGLQPGTPQPREQVCECRDADESGHALHEDPVELLSLFFAHSGHAFDFSHWYCLCLSSSTFRPCLLSAWDRVVHHPSDPIEEPVPAGIASVPLAGIAVQRVPAGPLGPLPELPPAREQLPVPLPSARR